MSRDWLAKTFHSSRPIIGMIHLLPLPGTPGYKSDGGLDAITDRARADLRAAQDGDIDGVMFCNEHDRPYLLGVGPEIVAAMSSIVSALRPDISVPFGIDVLWDDIAAVAIGHATGAAFIREVVTGAYASDFGLWNTNIGKTLRYRRAIGAERVQLFYNINAEFAAPLGERPLELTARSVAVSSLATVFCVSGAMTGSAPSTEDLQAVKAAVPDSVVICNTGLTAQNAAEKLAIADAAIVGTGIKVDGVTWNPIDPARVKSLMTVVRNLRPRLQTPLI
jgi:uncharacterized protein